MVTVEQVWAALDEIADPEIPVISLVELGVVRDVAVDGQRVHVSAQAGRAIARLQPLQSQHLPFDGRP